MTIGISDFPFKVTLDNLEFRKQENVPLKNN